MAARCKLTPDVEQRICQAVGAGATYALAAAYGGVSYETLRVWRETKPGFSAALSRAEAAAAVGWLERIDQAGEDDWRALAWKLERRFPHDYGRPVQQMEHTGAGGGPILYADLTDAELGRRLVALLTAVAPGGRGAPLALPGRVPPDVSG